MIFLENKIYVYGEKRHMKNFFFGRKKKQILFSENVYVYLEIW